MKKEKTWKIVLIVIGSLVLAILIGFIINSVITIEPKIEPLTEDDFKILGVSWNEKNLNIYGEDLDE